MFRIFNFIIIFTLAMGFLPAHANSDRAVSDNITAQFIDEDGKYGVLLDVKPGWHTYYKEPGDAGIPTVFDFKGSENFEVQEVVFPEFKVLDEYGFKTNAYEGKTFFPVKATAQNGAK